MKSRALLAVLVCLPAGVAIGWTAATQWPPAGRRPKSDFTRPVPKISAIEPRLRIDGAQKPTHTQVLEEIRRIARTRTLRFDKTWEIVVLSLEKQDMPAVIDAVLALPAIPARDRLLQLMFTRWGEVDPSAAMARAQAFSSLTQVELAANAVLQGWMYMAPEQMSSWAGELPEGKLRDAAMNLALDFLIEANPAAAVESLKGQRLTQEQRNKLTTAFEALAARDLTAAIRQSEGFSLVDRRNANLGIALAWASSEPAAAARWAHGLKGPNDEDTFVSVLQRWAQSDPEAAAEFFLRNRPRNGREFVLGNVLQEWANRDRKKAFAWVEALESPALREAALNGMWQLRNQEPETALEQVQRLLQGTARLDQSRQILQDWSSRDPEAALRFASGVEDAAERKNLMAVVIQAWAGTDPAGALSSMDVLGESQTNVMHQVIASLAVSDPRAARAYIDSIEPESARARASETAARRIAGQNPQTALDLVDRMPAGTARDNALNSVVQAWAGQEPKDALEWAENLPDGPEKERARKTLVFQLARADLAAAVALYDRMAPGTERDEARNSLATLWSQRDPDAALAWVGTMPAGPSREGTERQLINQLASQDPRKAITYLESMSPGLRTDMILQVANILARQQPDEAIKWAGGLSDAGQRNVAMSAAITSMSSISPEKAAAALAFLEVSPSVENAYSHVAGAWANLNPEAAANWGMTLSNPKAREQALTNVVQRWANSSPDSAYAWAATVSEAPLRDRLIASVISQSAQRNPAKAATAADSITDENTRHDALETVARGWLQSDHAAAAAWLSGASLPEARKKALLQQAAPSSSYSVETFDFGRSPSGTLFNR